MDLTAAEQADAVDAHRLAYLAEQVVNWSPGMGTVLAHEEVTAEGRSAVGNYPVYRRPLRQWMLLAHGGCDRRALPGEVGGLIARTPGGNAWPGIRAMSRSRRPWTPGRLRSKTTMLSER